MRMFKTMLAAGAGLAAFAAAAPAAAQYGYNPYTYNPYAQNPYSYSQYGYSPYGMNTSLAVQQCNAAVQSRLQSRQSLGSILGTLIGVPMAPQARVLSVTEVRPRNSTTMRVRGLATSGRHAYNPYGAYGVGAYGALGYNYASQADLSFRCDVDYRGYVRSVDINRR
ncbi:MAG TPA: hypothetical protein VM308_08955 [Sphingomicrobium sp.]|nr:hypothetical protein [Sphingomicrobium sp.]